MHISLSLIIVVCLFCMLMLFRTLPIIFHCPVCCSCVKSLDSYNLINLLYCLNTAVAQPSFVQTIQFQLSSKACDERGKTNILCLSLNVGRLECIRISMYVHETDRETGGER